MTRQEWFDSQDIIVQTKFVRNCITLNLDSNFFKYWIKGEHSYIAAGIQGAFPWCDSHEGSDYWRNLNNIYLEKVGA